MKNKPEMDGIAQMDHLPDICHVNIKTEPLDLEREDAFEENWDTKYKTNEDKTILGNEELMNSARETCSNLVKLEHLEEESKFPIFENVKIEIPDSKTEVKIEGTNEEDVRNMHDPLMIDDPRSNVEIVQESQTGDTKYDISNLHQTTDGSDIQRNSDCTLCRRNFSSRSPLPPHICPYFGEIISTRTESGDREYECSICRKKFTRICVVKRHMLMHAGVKPYECNICHKKFGQHGNLKTHVLIHTGHKSSECDICHKTFSQSSGLRKHMLIHAGIKQHKCSMCERKFRFLYDMKQHLLTHTEINQYDEYGNEISISELHAKIKLHECSICQKKFRRAHDVKRHMLIHTRITPYECNICQRKFNNVGNRKRHIALVHTDVKE